MIDSAEFLLAISQLEKEKGVNAEMLISTIKQALKTALKKTYNVGEDAILIDVTRETGKIRAFLQKTVIEDDDILNPSLQITLEDAKKINPIYEVGDNVQEELDLSDFKRVAAQTAKNYIRQQLRENEKNMLYNEFKDKKDEMITGIIQKTEKRNVIVDIGDYEGILPANEQVESEKYEFNKRMNFYISEVKIANKALQIVLSRTHPGLVKRLFEKEVPEISDGTVEIKVIFREAGSRTKIAVWSKNPDVDPVGACVGHKGERVQRIVDNLGGEKIDIIKWSEDPVEFISTSLSPAKVLSVTIVDEVEKKAQVVVPDYQLSLAIGKDGQNARLSARLTGWKIDIKPESEVGGIIKENTKLEESANMDATEDDIDLSYVELSDITIDDDIIVDDKEDQSVDLDDIE